MSNVNLRSAHYLVSIDYKPTYCAYDGDCTDGEFNYRFRLIVYDNEMTVNWISVNISFDKRIEMEKEILRKFIEEGITDI